MANESSAAVAAPSSQPVQSAQPNQPAQPASNAQGKGQPTQPSTNASIRKFKVDGQDVEVNLGDEKQVEQLLREAGLGKAAFSRMREAAEVKKNMDSFMEKLRKDPMSAIEDPSLGLTDEQRREVIEKYYQKRYLETDKLTPEQKRIKELEAELEKKSANEKKIEEDNKSKKQKELESRWAETYQQQIIQVLEKGGLPKTPRTAARVAFYMAQALESGFEAPLEMIVQQVGKDYEEELKSITAEEVPIEIIMKVLPPSLIKRIRKFDLDQYKAKIAKQNAPQQTPERRSAPRQKKDERLSYSQVLKKFGS